MTPGASGGDVRAQREAAVARCAELSESDSSTTVDPKHRPELELRPPAQKDRRQQESVAVHQVRAR